mmetsp:Transcript_41999/g.133412  ORF Transcript_41999/g.133412 Transcript_41999/m.133412 type:complete len:303 (-) Transcript_41999:585-1493(-)
MQDVLLGRPLQHAVAQVQDVPAGAASLVDGTAHGLAHLPRAAVAQDEGVHVALKHEAGGLHGPCRRRHAHAAVDAQDVHGAREHLGLLAQVRGAAVGKVDEGHLRIDRPHALGHGPREGRGEARPLLGAQAMRPGVKQLDALGPARDLEDGVVGDGAGKPPEKLLGDIWALVHPPLKAGCISRASCFDRVGSQRPGRSHKAQQAAFSLGLSSQGLQRFAKEAMAGHKVLWAGNFPDLPWPCQAVLEAPGKVPEHNGASPREHIKLNAQGREWGQDVREDDHGIHAVLPPTLQGELHSHGWCL